MATLNVLIENPDATIHSSTDFRYFALKAEDVAIQIARTPLQIPVPQASPFLFDIGSYRPSLTLSGVVDDVDTNDSISFMANTYRVPTQFQLTTAATDWVHRSGKQYVYLLLQIMIQHQTQLNFLINMNAPSNNLDVNYRQELKLGGNTHYSL